MYLCLLFFSMQLLSETLIIFLKKTLDSPFLVYPFTYFMIYFPQYIIDVPPPLKEDFQLGGRLEELVYLLKLEVVRNQNHRIAPRPSVRAAYTIAPDNV